MRVGENVVAFLQTGQVLPQAPTRAGFNRAARELLRYGAEADLKRLEEAYFQTRVVPKRHYDSILRLLAIFAQHLASLSNQLMVQSAAAEPPAITRAKRLIAERHTEELSLGEMARAVNMSAFYFCKSFRRATGMTFTDYLARVREPLGYHLRRRTHPRKPQLQRFQAPMRQPSLKWPGDRPRNLAPIAQRS